MYSRGSSILAFCCSPTNRLWLIKLFKNWKNNPKKLSNSLTLTLFEKTLAMFTISCKM